MNENKSNYINKNIRRAI